MKTKAVKQLTPKNEIGKEVKALSTQVANYTRHLILAPDIETPADAAEAVSQRNWLKAKAKEVKAKKDGIVKPLNEALKNVRELFRPIEARLDKTISDVTEGLERFNERAREELATKQERLEVQVEREEISEGKMERIIERAAARLGAEVVPTREVRVVKVVDESKIPRRYWQLDMVAVRKDALAGVAIPGVVVETESQVFVKG